MTNYKLTKKEALDALGGGHSYWEVDYAGRVCQALDIKWDKKIVTTYKNGRDAWEKTGGGFKSLFCLKENKSIDNAQMLVMDNRVDEVEFTEEEVSGVYGLRLTSYIAKQLGLVDGVDYKNDYFGRGSQAREIQGAIKKKLNI